MSPQAREPHPQFQPGDRVGNYVIRRLHAVGGNSSIYYARHTTLERDAAVKVLRQELLGAEFLARFRQEAEAISRLHHPHIVEVYDIIELPDGRPAIIMEWLEGKPLSDELAARGTFTAPELIALMKEIGSALGAVHRAGFVHRDIKPNNIIVIPEGNWFHVKLVDFGIVKAISSSDVAGNRGALTRKGVIIGTPDYMAPEQALLGAIDARTDLYALGVLMFQLATGRVPYVASDLVELLELHLKAPIPRASLLAPVPLAVDDVITRCLSKKPDDRYATVADMLEALSLAARPSPLPQASPAVGLGVYLELRISVGDFEEDELLFHTDSALEEARLAFEAVKLDVVLESNSAVLAVAPLDARPEQLQAVLLTCEALEALFAARSHGGFQVTASTVVHVGSLQAHETDGTRSYTDGELLQLPERATQLPPGVLVSDTVLAMAPNSMEFRPAATAWHRLQRRRQ